MKKFTSTQLKLLYCLADGLCHSGINLGTTTGVSRTAIWKQIKQLTQLGVPIQSIPHQGYRLTTPLKLLNEISIHQQLKKYDFTHPVNYYIFASLDSTNRFLKEQPRSDGIDICCAETQTAGRGRFGRHWHSPFGENIYCSTRWHFDCDLSCLSGLSLVVSLAVIATLSQFGIEENIRVKWPNDILWHDKKLCGSLIEINAESNSAADVVVGIGLNVNSITKNQTLADKPWCSLFEITETYFDRNLLVSRLIIELHKHIQEFIAHGLPAFQSRWQKTDYLYGQVVTVWHPLGPLTGKAHGINNAGQLILIDENGTTHYLSSGDTSLKSKN